MALAVACLAPSAQAADPFASNNGLYPAATAWIGPYRPSNYAFPASAVSAWLKVAPRDPMTTANAARYVDALKQFIAPSMESMVEDPDHWSPGAQSWFNMPWTAEIDGTDATSGREAILGSSSGQIIPGPGDSIRTANAATAAPLPLVYADLKSSAMQNHTVVYYDAVAATALHKVWADPFSPRARDAVFPEGALVVKAGAVTATPAEWPEVDRSAIWHVFRPPVADQSAPPQVTPLRVMQFDVIVKDTQVSPKTGWVFITWIYDRNAPGARPWDRLVPLGAMWGNDPALADTPAGNNSGRLQETWINPAAPAYGMKTLGWGGRLSGPIDVSVRHGVVLTTGQRPPGGLRASSCLSCHGTSQYPFIANLYPSPNKVFPRDTTPFLLYPPGSPEWQQWFQDRPGSVAQSAANDVNAVGLDYDMLFTFALSNFNNAAGNRLQVQSRFRVH